MKHLVILGAGTAGTMVANRMRSKLRADWKLTIIDPEASHLYQPGLLFLPFVLGFILPWHVAGGRDRQKDLPQEEQQAHDERHPRADEHAGALFLVERAGAGAFGAVLAQHVVLLRREAFLPFGIGEHELADHDRLVGIGGGVGEFRANKEAQHKGEEFASVHGGRV